MKSIYVLIVICISVFTHTVQAEKQPVTDKEKFSYAVGVQLAQTITRQSIQLDLDPFL